MKSISPLSTPSTQPVQVNLPRTGVAMIIVLSLMAALAFLGFFFFSYTMSELDSATWFFSASNDPTSRTSMNPQLSTSQDPTDIYMDWAAEQVIVGTRREYTNSVLYGNKYSLMANMLGQIDGDLTVTDFHPFNGGGVKVIFSDTDNDGIPDDLVNNDTLAVGPDGRVDVLGADYDGDGDIEPFSVTNQSPGAGGWGTATSYPPTADATFSFSPDVDYTYPDINNLFLGHLTWVPNTEDVNGNGSLDPGEDTNGNSTIDFITSPVWIPSFHRPQYLQNWRVNLTANPWTDSTLATSVMRPHSSQHVTKWDAGTGQVVHNAGTPRFNDPQAFFATSSPKEGVWQRIIDQDRDGTHTIADGDTFGAASTRFDQGTYNYDMDADGDGVKEAIYLDLDFPPTPWIDTLNANNGPNGYGRKHFIPLFGVTILDADGLVNLNMSGNLNHIIDDVVENYDSASNTPRAIIRDVAIDGAIGTPSAVNPSHFFSSSNQGYTPFEINIARSLYASHTTHNSAVNSKTLDSIFMPYVGMFQDDLIGVPALRSQFKMANYDAFRLINGATRDYDNLGNVVTPIAIAGRHGEPTRVAYDLLGMRPDGATQWATFNTANRDAVRRWLFGRPGVGRLGNDDLDFVGIDDDNDGTIFAPTAGGGMPRTGVTINYSGTAVVLNFPSSVHPVDVLGTGDTIDVEYADFSTSGATRRLFDDNGTPVPPMLPNPSIWPYYKGNWQTLGTADYEGVTPYSAILLGTETLVEHPTSLLLNEPDELIVEPDFADLTNDSIFSASEMEALHLSDTDYAKVSLGKVSRLRELMPFNLRDHSDSRYIRKQFTTASWARREFSQLPMLEPASSGLLDRSWEYNDTTTWAAGGFPPVITDSTNTVVIAPYSATDPFRTELRTLLQSRVRNNSTIPSPLNWQRKIQLGYIAEDSGAGSVRFRPLTPHPVFDASNAGTPMSLLPHDNGAPEAYDPVLIPTDQIAQEWWARYDRQRLARDIYVLLYFIGAPDSIDGGITPFNPTNTPYPVTPAYDVNQNGVNDLVEKMAQYAVNMVDAIDPDDCITRFEYDSNLSDGWQFDLTASTPNDGDPATTADNMEMNFVYGVEAQSLTFSEAQWIYSKKPTSQTDKTQTYDDDSKDRHYLFIELRNALPKEIDLTTGAWRIRRLRTEATPGPDLTGVDEARLIFAPDPTPYAESVIAPGGLYTIGTHNSDETENTASSPEITIAAVYRTDTTGAGVFNLVSPSQGNLRPTPGAPANKDGTTLPVCDLDLVYGETLPTTLPVTTSISDYVRDAANFVVTDRNNQDTLSTTTTIKGMFFNALEDVAATEMTFVLERRMNLNHAYNNSTTTNKTNNINDYGDAAAGWIAPNRAWNEWVEADRITIPVRAINMESVTSNATMLTEQSNAVSKERKQPLHAASGPLSAPNATDGEQLHAVNAGTGISNTIGKLNSQPPSTGNFTLWQPHFDRPMTSAMEMLSVPVFGPKPLSAPLNSNWVGGVSHALSAPDAGDAGGATHPEKLSELNIASRWFLNPQGIDLDADGAYSTTYEVHPNRWYRILEFFEVEPQVHKSLADSGLLRTPRTPGKINLNTIRSTQPQTINNHPQAAYLSALGALVDDQAHFGLNFDLLDQLEASGTQTTRDWEAQFRISRDGIDSLTRLPLPGGIGSKPFRSLSYLDSTPADSSVTVDNTVGSYSPADRSLQSTILRKFSNYDPTNPQHQVAFSSAAGTDGVLENQPFSATALLENRRQIFEARTALDMAQDNVDFHTRHRLLSKIHNNTTNVSNVFYIFIGVEFFEATETTANSGFWQIGRKLTSADDPQFKMRRGFFVVDRSLLEKAIYADPTTGQPRIDFRKLILHRRKLAPYN